MGDETFPQRPLRHVKLIVGTVLIMARRDCSSIADHPGAGQPMHSMSHEAYLRPSLVARLFCSELCGKFS
jgi:hypothetical protein